MVEPKLALLHECAIGSLSCGGLNGD